MTQGKKVDINTADAATLESLSGIGEAKAKAIIEYREKNGKFKNLDDLSNVPGIGDKTKQTLIQHFGSVKRIVAASPDQLQDVLGEKRGAKLYAALHANNEDESNAEKEIS